MQKSRRTALTLLEVMVMFFVIGIVTVACMNLSKQKTEYMKKIAVYSAYKTLSEASRKIATEGYVPFLTDIYPCTYPRAEIGGNWVCTDYHGYGVEVDRTDPAAPVITGLNANSIKAAVIGLLPAAVSRRTFDPTGTHGVGADEDPSLHLSDDESENNVMGYHFLQQGLCQRYVHVLNVNQNNCGDFGGIADNPSFIANLENANFNGIIPAFITQNGYSYYISNGYYRSIGDAATSRLTLLRDTSPQYADIRELVNTYDDFLRNSANFNAYANKLFDEATVTLGNNYLPSDMYQFLLSAYRDADGYEADITARVDERANFEARLGRFNQNKDFVVVWIDINGPRQGANTLNDDVYCFRVYRNGLVWPVGRTAEFLTANITARVYNETNRTSFNRPLGSNNSFANVDYRKALCLARKVDIIDAVGLCSTVGIREEHVPATAPANANAVNSDADALGFCGTHDCSVNINKPNMFLK